MHLDHPVEGWIDGIYDDGPHNKILTVSFNGHADELPDHCDRGFTTSKFLLKAGMPGKDIHIGQVVRVTDVADQHPVGTHRITGIAVPGPSRE